MEKLAKRVCVVVCWVVSVTNLHSALVQSQVVNLIDNSVEPRLKEMYAQERTRQALARSMERREAKRVYFEFGFQFRDDDDGQDELINAHLASALWRRVAAKPVAPKNHFGYGGYTIADQQFCLNNVSGVQQQLLPALKHADTSDNVWKLPTAKFLAYLRQTGAQQPTATPVGCSNDTTVFGSNLIKVQSTISTIVSYCAALHDCRSPVL